ncbi:YaaL family protein [Salinimicrobium sp. MT39]|uniref:YaaL family protein n=2 Tax=Bacteria TaxID=2 RepID=A0A9X3D003_9FLAO|nr:YaaL family protein [Salinimicrobium profundisediminis]
MNMFFRKKGWLRKEYDEKLLLQIEELKSNWKNQSTLVEKSFDITEEAISDAKLAEAKYFFLFKEAKKRNVTVRY